MKPATADEADGLPHPYRRPSELGAFAAKVLVVSGVALVLLLMWRLQDVVMLLFGSVILATVLNAVVSRLEQHLGLRRVWAVLTTVLVLCLVLLLGGWLVGDRLAGELQNLREQLPQALNAFRGWLESQRFGDQEIELWDSIDRESIPWSGLMGAASLTFGAIGNALLIAILAIYLTVDPRLYRNGIVRLFPLSQRDRVRNGLNASGEGLAGWLMGQGISMLFVGISTAVGLALLGVPLAFSLGVIAAVLDFVPFFGPLASGALAVVVAFSVGPTTALYVAILALAIQQAEGSVLMPVVQRWAAQLPPVLGLISVLIFGMLFGPMGIIFATPLMVVLMILVQRIYVDDLLEGHPRLKSNADE